MEETGYENKSTEWLVERLENDGLSLDFPVAHELAKRPDCVPLVKEIIRYRYDSGGGWAIVHAVHLLGMIKTSESLDALVYAAVNRQEELDDWLLENAPGLLAGFGPMALEKLEVMAATEFLDEYVRGVAIRAISAIAWRHAEARERGVAFLKNIVENEKNTYLVADAICELADLHEASAVAVIKKAYAEGRVELEIVHEEDAVEDALGKNAWQTPELTFQACEDYFTEKNFSYLKGNYEESEHESTGGAWVRRDAGALAATAQSSGKKKNGRNHPCPCGSNKKYKKCCLKLPGSEL